MILVDDIVKCALCGATTPVTEVGVRKHDLAAKLAALLEEFTKPVQEVVNCFYLRPLYQKNCNRLPMSPAKNGSISQVQGSKKL